MGKGKKLRRWRDGRPATIVPAPSTALRTVDWSPREFNGKKVHADQRPGTKPVDWSHYHPQTPVASPTVVRTVALVEPTIWYWAYGSNLCYNVMQRRCPGARPVCAKALDNGALVFRGVADVVYREGSLIQGGLWLITKAHMQSLDRVEGVSSNFYLKRWLTLSVKGEERKCLYYQMSGNIEGIMPPNDEYYQTIEEGYHDFKLPLDALETALEEAWENKQPTRRLIRRHNERGGKFARLKE